MFRAYGLYSHIRRNRMKSALLLLSFVLLIHAVLFSLLLVLEAVTYGGTVDEIVTGALGSLRVAWPLGLIACAAWFLIAFAFHQRMIDFATRARGIERAAEPRLYNALENLCISRGIAMPRLKIIEAESTNAFASGLRPGNYSIAVTRGLIDRLPDRELDAVLAHELTHIRNRDTQMMVIAVIFAGIIAFIGDLTFRSLDFPFGYSPRRHSGADRERGSGGGALVIILVALAVIAVSWGFSVLIRLALSRLREFLADAGAAELTLDPDAMIAALRRIEATASIEAMPSRMHAFFIESPAASPGRGWFATHPSVEERVEALVAFAGGIDKSAAAPATRGPWS